MCDLSRVCLLLFVFMKSLLPPNIAIITMTPPHSFHHKPHPLLSLPQHVLDAVFAQLSPATLANCSLVCRAWQNLPYEHLPTKLVLQSGPQAVGILDAGLHRCRHLTSLWVTSSTLDPVWPGFAAALAQQQLPSLRELHIQHSSQTDAAHLAQLQAILQVQPQCVLHLALTDKASLQALLPLLPLRGLASLELNVPYLAEGALQLLLHAAAVQAAALSSSSRGSSHAMHPSAAPQQQGGVLRVGLWVCCWGGCPGLLLSDAVALHGKLQQLPCCAMVGCESVNITSTADLAALSQLQGLEGLGINFVQGNTTQTGRQDALQQPGVADAAGQPAAGSETDGNCDSSGGSADVMRALTCLSCSLKQLSIRGAPSTGWGTAGSTATSSATATASLTPAPQLRQQLLASVTPQQDTLAALTGLTKLSLQKDWAQPALPVGPITALTLLQELAFERRGLQHPAELDCLSSLVRLRVLSLVLTVTADELVDAVQGGSWQLAGPTRGPAHWLQQQQQACAAMLDRLSLLQVREETPGGLSGMEWGTDDGADGVCSCCLGAAGAAGGAGSSAEAGAGELLQEVVVCPVLSDAGVPVLLDWGWLTRLQRLETAWLQVPHLDLSCLPNSLVELDAQQPRDLTRVSITCCHSRGIHLPRLQRLVLPHLLQPTAQQLLADPSGMLAADADGADSGMRSSGSSSSSSQGDSEEGPELQCHFEAVLLLSLAAGCPELRELELVQWQPPSVAVLAAVRELHRLKLLSVVAPEGCAGQLQQAVQSVRARHRLRPVELQLAEALVLSSYPWSSVLAVR